MPREAVAEVVAIEADGNIKFDDGSDDGGVADHYADPGEDSLPLPGDSIALGDGPGTGIVQSAGYHDPKNPGQAAPGEKRTYSRTPAGVLAATIWLKGDGTILIRSELAPSGGTFEIDPATGSITMNGKATVDALGEVTAKSDNPATKNTMTGHMTASPMGPLPVIPGT